MQRTLQEALTPEERNQAMGHTQGGSTFQRYYMPDLIERDFQSIYFGTPAHDDLIQAIARMGLSRDRRAPTELTDAQKDELRENPELVKFREKRDRCTAKIRRCLKPDADTDLKRQREQLTAKIHSTLAKLHRERLNQAIREFTMESTRSR